jgi:thiosulfate dehydrogenase (quinone)
MKNEREHANQKRVDVWPLLAYATLAVRLVQGWIYWGGASRRLIYAPQKLDPDSAGYMGGKLLHAAPGAAFDLGRIIEWLIVQPTLLHVTIIGFTLVELALGLGLLFGLATRLFALVSMIVSVFLMLNFGWLGATCIDEWTMAANSFAMGAILVVAGGSALSLDAEIIRKTPSMGDTSWFIWCFSGPLPIGSTKKLGLWLGIASIAFTVFFYDYYRGAVYSPLHARTSPKVHTITITHASVDSRATVRFTGHVSAGPDTGNLYIIGARIEDSTGKTLVAWDGRQLKDSTLVSIDNVYPYDLARFSQYGIAANLASRAGYTFHPPRPYTLSEEAYTLILESIDGRSFKTPLAFEGQ